MKLILSIAIMLVVSNCFASTRIYGDVSNGPFHGSSYSLSYNETSNSCIESRKGSDGPFNGYSNKEEVNISKCELFIEALKHVQQEGKCIQKSKTLGKVSNGPFKSGKVILTRTEDCLCIRASKGSEAPYEGYETRDLEQLNVCDAKL